MICNLNVQIWLNFDLIDVCNFLEDGSKLDIILNHFLMIKLGHFGNDIDKVIEFIELELNGQQITGNFEKLWSLYLVKCHTNGNNFDEDWEILLNLLKAVVKNLVFVNKRTTRQIASKGESGVLITNVDEILSELNGSDDASNVIEKWIELHDSHSSKVTNQVNTIHLETVYVGSEAKQLSQANVQTGRRPSDSTSDEEEEEVCKYIRLSSLEDSPFSAQTVQSCRITYLPTYNLLQKFKALKFTSGLKYRVFGDIHSSVNSTLSLFHGPPGCGKTSLAQGLSNSLAIASNSPGVLIELSCGQVLSKYMNESDKNIDSLFKDIENYMDRHSKHNVYLVIDEIETLVRDRRYLLDAVSTNAPLQVVNTMLVSLDRMKQYPKLHVFTTSNLIENLDAAFIDRVGGIYHIPTVDSGIIERVIIYHMSVLFPDFDIASIEMGKVSLILHRMGVSGRVVSRGMTLTPHRGPIAMLNDILYLALKRCRDVSN